MPFSFDIWAIISVRYKISVIALRAKLYRMAAEDPMYAKMVLSGLDKRGDLAASSDLTETLGKLESHMNTQLMNEVATRIEINEAKRAKGNGGGEPMGISRYGLSARNLEEQTRMRTRVAPTG